MNDYLRDAWKYYEYGRLYNNNLTPNQYTMVNTNNEFFIGNQWIHMPDNEAMRRQAKPTFKHNNFAQRMPIVEVQLGELMKRVEALERRS